MISAVMLKWDALIFVGESKCLGTFAAAPLPRLDRAAELQLVVATTLQASFCRMARRKGLAREEIGHCI